MNFGPIFINQHLMPLLEKILVDAREGTKPYLQNELLLNGTLSEISKRDFMNTYFISQQADNGVTPFAKPEQSKEREQFLQYFIQYIRARGANPEQRAALFLPQQDKDSREMVWSASIKRNLFLLSYSMAQQFEHDHISELIDLQKDEVKKAQDRELLEQGRLILIASTAAATAPGAATQTAAARAGAEVFNTYRSIDDLKQGENVTMFIPSPTAEVQAMMGFGSDQQRRQAIQMSNNLMALDLIILEEPKLDAQGNLFAKVKSGSQTLTVSLRGNYHFTFDDGPNAGKQFTLKASQLHEAFDALKGVKKEAIQLYEELKNQKDFHPNQPPQELPKNTVQATAKNPSQQYMAKLLQRIGRPDSGLPQTSEAPLPEGSTISGRSDSSTKQPPYRAPEQAYSAAAIRSATKGSTVKEFLPPRQAAQALAAQRKFGGSPVRRFSSATAPGATTQGTGRGQTGAPRATSTKPKKGFTVGKAALVGNVAAVAAALGLATHGAGAKTVGYTFKIMVAFLGHSIG